VKTSALLVSLKKKIQM